MRKLLLSLFVIAGVTSVAVAQEISMRNYIEVVGEYTIRSAPDSVVMGIVLSDTATASKSSIAQDEKSMIEVLKKLGIDTNTALRAQNFSTSAAKRNNIAAEKSFDLTLNSTDKIDAIFKGLNDKGITNVNVNLLTMRNLKAIQLKAKTEATKNAKVKATALVEAIGSKLGVPIYIVDSRPYYQPIMFAKSSMNAAYDTAAESSQSPVEYKDVVIEENITVRFLIE